VDVEALRRFRSTKDQFFATHPSSPLTPRQRARFRGLVYFPPNPELVVECELDTPLEVELTTSYGDRERYRRAGLVRFDVGGNPVLLTLLRSDRKGLFAPFRDATSGSESYDAGRYLEARSLGDGRVLLDFNYAYNPYCAYDPGWRCPIPPRENHLAVRIGAGGRRYPDPEPASDRIGAGRRWA
jgi:hypothetical protein